MRILHVVEAFGGGQFEILRALADRQLEAGDQVALAYGMRPETPAEVSGYLHPGVRLYPAAWERRTTRAQVTAGRQLRMIAREWQPDLIHLHSSFAGLLGSLVLRGWAPLIYTPHAYSFTRGERRAVGWLYRRTEWLVARRVALVAACSESEARLARDVVGAPRVAVVANGIRELDPGELPDKPPRSGRPVVVALGRAEPQRQPEACAGILAAIADMSDVAWIGGGRSTAALERAGVPLTGWVDHDEAMRRLGEATAYLHWTAWDGLPLSIMEAMARDVVVVASDIGANEELLGARQVCATEKEAIALLRRVLTEPELRGALLDSQRARRDRFSGERMARDCRAVYRRVLRGEALEQS